MFCGAVMQFRIIGQSAQYTNALLKIFVQKTTLLILLLTHWSPFIRHGLTEQFQIIIRIFFINPVSIFLNRGKRELRWNKNQTSSQAPSLMHIQLNRRTHYVRHKIRYCVRICCLYYNSAIWAGEETCKIINAENVDTDTGNQQPRRERRGMLFS